MSVLLFGKLPAQGDFVARGWLPAERAALDGWLAASLADARRASAPRFDALYDRAPPWRCMVGAADAGFAGALALSQDAAGRRFPLFLAIRGGAVDAAAACEELLYAAIAEQWSVDVLVARAAALATDDAREGDGREDVARWWTLGGEGFAEAELAGARPAALIAMMLGVAEPMP